MFPPVTPFLGEPLTVTTVGWVRQESWGDVTVLFYIVCDILIFLKHQRVSSAVLRVLTCVERSQAICLPPLPPHEKCAHVRV